MRSLVLTMAAVLALAASARAGTEFEDFTRKVGKYAPVLTSRAEKTLCACLSGERPGAAGRLVQQRQPSQLTGWVPLACEVPRFAADGSVTTHEYCFQFVTLAK
jgi:hypothetical protein